MLLCEFYLFIYLLLLVFIFLLLLLVFLTPWSSRFERDFFKKEIWSLEETPYPILTLNAGEILELGNIPSLVKSDRFRFDWFALD